MLDFMPEMLKIHDRICSLAVEALLGSGPGIVNHLQQHHSLRMLRPTLTVPAC